jgi:PAS domain S-box-containing protein
MATDKGAPAGSAEPTAGAGGDGGGSKPADSDGPDLYPGVRDGSNESLRAERDFWKHLFDSMIEEFPEAVIVVDDEGTLTHWNPAHEDIANVPAEEAVGQNAYDVLGTEGEEETLAEEIARTGRTIREETLRSTTDPEGNRYHIRCSGTPLRAPDGEVVGAFELVSQVTELVEQRKTLEELQDRMTDEVESLVAELLDSAERIAASSQQIGAVASDQAGNLDDLSGEIERLSATIQEIASSAEEVNRMSGNAEETVVESHESAEETPLRAGPRVPLTGAGGSVPLGLESNPFVARELVVAARASVAFKLRRQATQATLLYFRDGRPTAYQLLNFSPSSTGSPYVRSDDAGYLYATWLERAEERGFLVYLGSTAPDVLDRLDRLTLPDVGRMAAETIFGMLAGAALSPFVGILWLIGPLLALGLTSFLRRESEGTIAAGSLLSLVLALVIYWAVKLSTLPGATDYVPFSASIPIVPQWMEAPLRWGVMLTIMIVSLLTAWHFTYRRKTQSALYFILIYVGVDSVLSLAIYGSIIFGFV